MYPGCLACNRADSFVEFGDWDCEDPQAPERTATITRVGKRVNFAIKRNNIHLLGARCLPTLNFGTNGIPAALNQSDIIRRPAAIMI